MNILRIAAVTVREMIRKRLVITGAFLVLGFAALSAWWLVSLVAQKLPTLALTTASITIMMANLFAFVLALGGAFIAAPLLAGDVESGLLLPIATRRIARVEIVLGKFVGVASVLCAFAFGASLLELGVVRAITGYVPPHPIVAVTSLACVGVVMLALALALSSRLSAAASGIIALVVYGTAWISGLIGDVGRMTQNDAFATAGIVSQLVLPSDAFWRVAAYHLEPAALIAVGGHRLFLVEAPPPPAMMMWSACWIVGMLGLACWSFSRRDL